MFIPKLRADSFCHLTQSFSGVLVQPPQENLTWYLPVTGDRGKHFFWVALSESAFEMRLIQGAFFWAPIQKHPEIHLNLLLHMTCGIDLFRQTNPATTARQNPLAAPHPSQVSWQSWRCTNATFDLQLSFQGGGFFLFITFPWRTMRSQNYQQK